MMEITRLTGETEENVLERLLKRSPGQYKEQEETVASIVEAVKKDRDAALFSYEKQFDHIDLSPENIEVSEAELRSAYDRIDQDFLSVIRHARENIVRYHEKQLQNSWFETEQEGVLLGQKITALSTVGVYVPGGKAAYPSSVLMNILPAKVAGVGEVIMTTPPGPDGEIYPTTLVAAHEAGADRIFKCGGAQAIAAMAFGTESIPRVDKIVGPGNIYVALAKKAVFGLVGIDSIAGPSEILVLCDETADPVFVAADLLSQAEHDEMASAILVTTSETTAKEVAREIERQTRELSRREIIEKSLQNYGFLLVTEDMEAAIRLVNRIAPEHLEIHTKEPFDTMTRIQNAGAIFLGPYSSEPLGDYFAGPNHVLPTNGTARFFSALGVDAFVKRTSVISYGKEALGKIQEEIRLFAEHEYLTAHANSVRVRFEGREEKA